MKVVTAEEMREIDKRAREEFGIPTLLLMEIAGEKTAEVALDMLKERKRVVVVAGKGNNGGDGIVCARHLFNQGISVEVFLLASKEEIKGDAKANLEIAERLGIEIVENPSLEILEKAFASADLIIDAIFGTGFQGKPQPPISDVVKLINRSSKPVLAVDVPSGVSDQGDIPDMDLVVKADRTVTFGFPKLSIVQYPGAWFAGEIYVADIGIPRPLQEDPSITLLTPFLVKEKFLPRVPFSHKGDFGHLLVLAGSVGFTGAATLSCEGALRVGTGLVTLGIPQSLNEILEVKLTEAMTLPLPETEAQTLSLKALSVIEQRMERYTAIAMGPGLSTHPETCQFVRQVIEKSEVPLVLDADALNCLAGGPLDFSGKKVILTPHPGEMARLLGTTSQEVQKNRVGIAKELAMKANCVVVLKGARTVIADKEGHCYINPTGNPGMATGGTGDVLTGMIGGFLAQGYSPLWAGSIGVFLHGLAGDLAREEWGEDYILATDLIRYIADAFDLVRSYRRRLGKCVKLLDWL